MKGVYRKCSVEELRAKLAIFKRLQSVGLDAKIRFTEKIIDMGLVHGKSAVMFSGGKDSTVLLDILLKKKPEILIIHNDTTLGTPELLRFIREQTRGHNYVETTAEDPIKMWQATGYWPIFGKRSHNQYKKIIPGLRVSPVQCCYQLKEKYSNRILKDNKIRIVFWGNRAGESQRRRLTFLDNGYLFKAIKYPWMQCYPLQHWSAVDIQTYLEEQKIERPIEVSMETGCLACATDITFYPNNLSRLYLTNRIMWEKYMRAGFADQILKIKQSKEKPDDVIKYKPALLLRVRTGKRTHQNRLCATITEEVR